MPITPNTVQWIEGTEVASNATSRTQVYKATHAGDGNYLPYMKRSFISFSYGGRNIEDFELIATVDGDRMQRPIYASFSDNVTTSTVYDGQIYWSTHFNTNSLDLTLSTDGMTEQQLDDFKRWFKPGRIEELILAEHPNRGILARVSQPPEINMLPFEKRIEVKIAASALPIHTSTTEYKGSISLSFVMDDPFWYSLRCILNDKNAAGGYTTFWTDANGQQVPILESADAVKILTEDNVLAVYMFQPNDGADTTNFQAPIASGDGLVWPMDSLPQGLIDEGKIDVHYIAFDQSEDRDNGVSISATSDLENFSPNDDNCGYLYYGGTAPCYPKVKFSLTPVLNNNGYVIVPNNSIANQGKEYNTLVLRSEITTEFKFTTPNFYSAYNQAVQILDTVDSSLSLEDIRVKLRDNVKHYLVRKYAIKYLNETNDATAAKTKLKTLLIHNNVIPDVNFEIDGKNGKATATIKYYDENEAEQILEKENVEDMICSEYPLIVDRNYPVDWYITYWQDTPALRKASHIFYADIALKDVKFEYKYLYL